MLFGIIYCFFALLWAGMACMLGYVTYDSTNINSRPLSFFLGLATFCALIEFILLMGIGIAMIAGYH